MARRVIWLLLVVAAAAGLWAFWSGSSAPPPTETERGEAQQTPAMTAEAHGERPASQQAEPSRSTQNQAPAERTAQATPSGSAAFVGRVLGPGGQPLADTTISLRGSSAGERRMTNYDKATGGKPIEWSDPEAIRTEADGRFELRFDPPPPYRFALAVQHADFAKLDGKWLRVQPGQRIDLGDIQLVPGTRVVGRLVDRDGRPMPAPEGRKTLQLYKRPNPPRDGLGPPSPWVTWVRDDGTFEFGGQLHAGKYSLYSQFIPLVGPFDHKVSGPLLELAVVIERPEDIPTITGTVVDGAGRPIGQAVVSNRNARRGPAVADSEGRFVLPGPRGEGQPQPARLSLEATGYLTRHIDEPVAWGTRDAMLTMTAGARLVLHVLDAQTKAPIERFGATIERVEDPTYFSSSQPVRGGWDHPGGKLELTVEGTNRHVIAVAPDPASAYAETTRIVDLGDAPAGTSHDVTILLHHTVRMPVTIVDQSGKPCPESEIELISPQGRTIHRDTVVSNGEFFGSDSVGRMVRRTTTDKYGHAVLEGAPDRTLALRVFGEHEPHVRQPFQLRPDPLEIRVSKGGTLEVETSPLRILEQLKKRRPRDKHPVQVALIRIHEGRTEPYPCPNSGTNAVIDAAGRAVLRGVPNGTWQMLLIHPTATALMRRPIANDLVIRDGQVLRVQLDLSEFAVGRLTGRLRLNGQTPPSGLIELRRALGRKDLGGEEAKALELVRLAKDGSFDQAIAIGEWTAAYRPSEGGPITLPKPVWIVEGRPTSLEVDLEVAEATVTIQGLDGAAAPNLALWITDQEGAGDRYLRTDTNGQLKVLGTPGTYRVRSRPRSLQDDDAFQELWRKLLAEHRDHAKAREASAATWIDVGKVQLERAKAAQPTILRLPPEWDR